MTAASPEALVAAFADALNRGDTDALGTLFIDFSERLPIRGLVVMSLRRQ